MGGKLFGRKDATQTVYYHQDGLGSTVALTDENGNILNKYAYDPFGELHILQETVENSLLFTGELFDQSGLIYLRARYYDPKTGRFVSSDKYKGGIADPSSQNSYAYCGNNPINAVDPSGLVAVAIRDYTNQYGYTVTWDDTWGVASFSMSGITLWATGSGYNDHGIKITNVDGRLQAESSDLDAFFGQALTWGKQEGKAGNIAMGGLAMGGGIALVDSPVPGPADIAGGVVVGGALVIAGGVAIYEMATAQRGKYGDATVKDVLKHRKGSIRQAPLPPGSPGWDKLLPLTMEAVRKAADKGETGFKTIWKLLNDSRFYK